MRILFLTILFLFGFYFFSGKEEKVIRPVAQEDDSIKLHYAAPNREERLLTVKTPPPVAPQVEEAEVGRAPSEEVVAEPAYEDVDSSDQVEEVSWSDLDAGWNNELKDMLLRLEPQDGEAIHETYLKEVDSYRAEMEALLNERQQKQSMEEVAEVDQMIAELDQKHEYGLMEIFGAHYEAIKDHYNYFMESGSDSHQ